MISNVSPNLIAMKVYSPSLSKKENNLTEEMKNTNQLYLVGMMNNFKNEAEEIVFNELISPLIPFILC